MSRLDSASFGSNINNSVLAFIRTLSEEDAECDGSLTFAGNKSYRDTPKVHPEIVERLWGIIAVALDEDCRGVFCKRPVLYNPVTEEIFAFGFGTMYALQAPPVVGSLNPPDNSTMMKEMRDGTIFDLESVGKQWVFGSWSPLEIDWCKAQLKRLHADI